MTTERWTDERIDRLADSVAELHTSVTELRGSVTELRITTEALLQTAVLHQQSIEASQAQL